MSKTRKDTIRENLFKKYSANWKLVRPLYNFHELDERINKEFVEATLCPLCMRVFKEQALNQQTDLPLTLEHLPPEELGGKPSILLCKKCNSTTGHDIDSKLLEYLKVMPFHSSEPKSSVRLKNTTIKS